MRFRVWLLLNLAVLCFSQTAHAEFIITSAILEFTAGGSRQQDIELVSRSKESDYIVSEISEIIHPGAVDENRVVVDGDAGYLLVTPEKTILAAGARKVLRFVLLKAPDAEEHIYRVTVKPVIKGVDHAGKVGLKVLIGYEVLVIIRPAAMVSSYTAIRHGRTLEVVNHGNTNILLQNGQQCTSTDHCQLPPVMRIYAGQKTEATLPVDAPVTYTMWDGATSTDRTIE